MKHLLYRIIVLHTLHTLHTLRIDYWYSDGNLYLDVWKDCQWR